MKLKNLLSLCILCLLVSTSLGCEAFRRKFVRKPKRKKEIKVVTQTIDYQDQSSVDENYKKYFLYWQAAHDELVDLLNAEDSSRKRQLYFAQNIVQNLEQMGQFLIAAKQEQLDVYIQKQEQIQRQLSEDNLNPIQVLKLKKVLKKQKRQIQGEFDLRDIQEYLVEQ